MSEELLIPERELERRVRWDTFLDAYSVYLREPTPLNAANLHLAGVALAQCADDFSLEDFEATHLGWNLAAL
jgi:hypothetical protein